MRTLCVCEFMGFRLFFALAHAGGSAALLHTGPEERAEAPNKLPSKTGAVETESGGHSPALPSADAATRRAIEIE